MAAVYYDYAVDRGVIVMDRATFVRHFGDLTPTGIAAYLKPGADPEQVRGEMLEGLDEGHRAFIYTNATLRAEVLRIFDSTFAITYALEIIAIVVAMLGVAATLLTLVLERRRELSMLRLIGADRRQVQRVVVIEAALIGAVSQAHRPRGRLRVVAGTDLRHQRAELRMDDSVPRAARCFSCRCQWRWLSRRRWPASIRRGAPRGWWLIT